MVLCVFISLIKLYEITETEGDLKTNVRARHDGVNTQTFIQGFISSNSNFTSCGKCVILLFFLLLNFFNFLRD